MLKASKWRGACIAEWYHTWLWSVEQWAMGSSLGDDKLSIGPKHNVYTFHDSIWFIGLILCQIFHVNCGT